MADISQILSKLEIQKNRDETYSPAGSPNHNLPESDDILTVTTRRREHPRTRKSQNNSYS